MGTYPAADTGLRIETMGNNPSKTKRCPECKLWIDAASARPLSRTLQGGGLRLVCPDCYAKVMALRKAIPSA